MRSVFWILPIFGLSACLGSSGFEGSLEIENSNFTQTNLVGRSLSSDAVAIGRDEIVSADGAVTIDSAMSAILTVDDETYALSNFGGTSFASVSGSEEAILATRLTNAPVTPDVIYVFAQDAPTPSLAGSRVVLFADGNNTDPSGLPSGSATYTGAAHGVSFNNQVASGTVDLTVDFLDNSFFGSLSGVNPNNPSASYSVAGSEVSGDLTGLVSGSGAVGGSLEGAIYGSDGDQAAGTFVVVTPIGSVGGIFGAAN